MELADRDEAELVAPTKTFLVEYDRPRQLFRWNWKQRVREHITLRTLSLRELQHVARIYGEIEKRQEVPIDVATALVILVGVRAYYMTPDQLDQLWKAHCELNLIPKAKAADVKFPDLRTPPSSAELDAGLSTSPTTVPST